MTNEIPSSELATMAQDAAHVAASDGRREDTALPSTLANALDPDVQR